VNGDGFDDVIVGAYKASPIAILPQLGLFFPRISAGAAYVIFGRASGFTTVDLAGFNSSDFTGFIIQGTEMTNFLGISVSGAGDVNNDGYADVIVGAEYASPNGLGRGYSGAAYVIFGMASGFTTLDTLSFTSNTSAGYMIQGAVLNDRIGNAVSGAGDVNNDGYADVIVGAGSKWVGGAGAAYVIFGMASGFANVDLASFISSDSTGFIIQGAVAGDWLGMSVSGAGDVNGDGFDDVIVGAPLADPNVGAGRSQAGVAYVIFGKAAGFTTLAIVNFTSRYANCYILYAIWFLIIFSYYFIVF
jgi:hypothetical protein